MEEQDLNESSTNDDDDELMMINNNQPVIRSKSGSFISRTNGPLTCRTNGPLTSRENESIVLGNNFSKKKQHSFFFIERGVRGKVITINRAKHYGFLKR